MPNWPIEQLNSTGEDVRSVQHLLRDHGAGITVDGIFGAHTQHAVRDFQGSHGLTVDGIVGNHTWTALIVSVQLGVTSEAVKAVQSQIRSRTGTLAVDGIFGPDTDDVVRNFQDVAGLAVDGIVGPHTWFALVSGVVGASNPQDAATRVFTAWTHADQAEARKNATAQAVTDLFSHHWHGSDGWVFGGSDAGGGSAFVSWKRPGGELVLQVNNNTGAPFFYVTGVTFSP